MKKTGIYRVIVLILVCAFFTDRVIIYSFAEEIDDSKYVEISQELINCANNEDNYNIKVSSYNEIYGEQIEEISTLSCEDIAKYELCSYFGENNLNNISLSTRVRLYDSNDVNTYVGYNFNVKGKEGYITVATHTKTVLVREINETQKLPINSSKVYYLSMGEIYYLNGKNYYSLDNRKITINEFKELLNERKEGLLNLNTGILANIELNAISQINNLLFIKEYGDNWYSTKKKYAGQVGYGYGGITDCDEYLKSKYGYTLTLVAERSLNCDDFTMGNLEKNVNNCVLTAITRVFCYHKTRGYNFENNEKDVYARVKKVAKKYGYTANKGTHFWCINDIINDLLDEYGYSKVKCWTKYRYTFNEVVKNEIDKKCPVIMNIAFGYYGNHTVTVCGYKIYNENNMFFKNRKHNLIEVYDGWSSDKRYIDYETFAYEILTGYGSFNILRFK